MTKTQVPIAILPGILDIIAPLITLQNMWQQPMHVTIESPLAHRRAVYKIACYFRREMKYDGVQYGEDGYEDDHKHVAFLWIHPEATPVTYKARVPCIGATCFRWREWIDAPAGWAMQWLWIHPYFRRRKLLTQAWPEFKEVFGDFFCEPPLSFAMTEFLKSR